MIYDAIREDYPDTTPAIIEGMLARRKNPRGCGVLHHGEEIAEIVPPRQAETHAIDASVLATMEAEDAERGASPEEYIDPQVASEQLKQNLAEAFRTSGEYLFLDPAGLGKTSTGGTTALEVLCGLRPDNRVFDDDRYMLRSPEEAFLNRTGGPRDFQQAVFAFPRHEFAKEMAEKVEGKFRQHALEDRVPIQKGYVQEGMCQRRAEASALQAKGFPIYGNLCDSKHGRCPHFRNEETGAVCPMIAQRRDNAKAPILFAMHGHVLTDKLERDKPAPDLSRAPWAGGHYANLANAEPLVFDEFPITALIDRITLHNRDIKKLNEILAACRT